MNTQEIQSTDVSINSEKDVYKQVLKDFDDTFEDKPILLLNGQTIFWLKGTERGAGTQDVKSFISQKLKEQKAQLEERHKREIEDIVIQYRTAPSEDETKI